MDSKWITEEEKGAVIKFRERVWDKLPKTIQVKEEDDLHAFLLRWLRARGMNLDKAEGLLLKSLNWREDNKLDKVLGLQLDPFLLDKYHWTFAGRDHLGNPVTLVPVSKWDLRVALKEKKMEAIDLFLDHIFESVMMAIEISNKMRKPGEAPVTQFFSISDFSSFSYGQMLSPSAMKKWFQMATNYESYYPETMFRVVCLNCSSYFKHFLNLFKAIVAPRTLAKVMCYTSVEEWRKDVELYMDPKILPVEYGGTRVEKAEELFRPSIQARLGDIEGIMKNKIN